MGLMRMLSLLLILFQFEMNAQKSEGPCDRIFNKNIIEQAKTHFSEYEKELLEDEILKSTNGNGYVELLEGIVLAGGVEYIKQYNSALLDTISLAHVRCLHSSSGLNEYPEFLEELRTSFEKDELQEVKMAKLILKYFEPDDISSDLLKWRLLQMLYMGAYRSLEEWRVLSPVFNNPRIDNSAQDSLFIEVDIDEERVYVNGSAVTKRRLQRRILNFISEYPKYGKVIVEIDRELPYDTYKSYRENINAPYNKIRDKVANRLYKKNYKELDTIEAYKEVKKHFQQWVVFREKSKE